jgi:hypothetical protein
MLTIEEIIFIITMIIILILLYVNKNKLFSEFSNDMTVPSSSQTELDENGFVRNELKPSYWYNYSAPDTRSKCFACDAESNYRHGSNCIDCEMKGGRPVDKLLNRVLTR